MHHANKQHTWLWEGFLLFRLGSFYVVIQTSVGACGKKKKKTRTLDADTYFFCTCASARDRKPLGRSPLCSIFHSDNSSSSVFIIFYKRSRLVQTVKIIVPGGLLFVDTFSACYIHTPMRTPIYNALFLVHRVAGTQDQNIQLPSKINIPYVYSFQGSSVL